MAVYFLLPSAGHSISGGFKVIYEYASWLAEQGHRVEVIHPANGDRYAPLFKKLWRLWRWIQWGVGGTWKPSWFSGFPAGLVLRWVPSLRLSRIREDDHVVYSSYLTAEWAGLHRVGPGRGFYLVHDYEHYMVGTELVRQRILRSFHPALKLIVTSPAGAELVGLARRVPDFEVPNGIDVEKFCPPERGSERNRIGFPARPEAFKGTADAVNALERIHQRYGDRYLYWAFGPYDRPLPDWVEWYPRLSEDELIRRYQESVVFVTPSHFEGWGLPGSEAMACGATLVSTDHGGVRAYGRHEENALLSPIQDPEMLAQNIQRLLEDTSLRRHLSEQGRKTMLALSKAEALRRFQGAVGL